MIIKFATQEAAQAAADAAHQYLINTDPHYAASVAAGQTTAYSDVWEQGGKFCIHLEDRAQGAFDVTATPV